MNARKILIFFSRGRRHTRWNCDWSSDVCSSDLSIVDLLICVGARAKFIADSATQGVNEWSSRRMTAFNQMSRENIYRLDTSDEAKLKVKELIKEGDLILVKGSQGMRMEKVV